MIFSKFEIQEFRCFKEKQILKLATPRSDKQGSGITYIVGENNSGKTTILEGLLFKNNDIIQSSDKQGNELGFSIFENQGEVQKLMRKVSLVRSTSNTLCETNAIPADAKFEVIQSRRGWKSAVNNTISISGAIQGNKDFDKPRSDTNFQITSCLKDIESDREQYDKFICYIKKVLPDFHSFSIGNDEHEFIEYQTKDGKTHRSDFLGDGVISIIRIIAHLFYAGSNPIIIDEPELSLHPSAQKRLLELIADASQTRQIIIATHSPYFVSWEYIKNGATLNRVFKEDEGNSRICSLQDYSIYQALISGANWQQPFLMDVVAKEIFFNDNVLFVEGQEDVGLLRKEGALRGSVNLFGYGVRGKNAFKIALQLARDLGVKKAGVLLDKGETEDAIKTELQTTFAGEGYQVFQWDRGDIRDKEPFEAQAKSGYFTIDGKRKTDDQLGDYQQKINAINSYFDH